MDDYKMICGCFLAGKGFKIGRKYVQIFDAHSGKCLSRCELTDEVKSELAKVKMRYPFDNMCQRVDAVEDIVMEASVTR